MKKNSWVIILSLAITLLVPSAYAQESEISAIYAAPYVQIVSDENCDEVLATTVLYIFDDGTFKQYVICGNKCEVKLGQYALDEEQSLIDLGFIRIYPQMEDSGSVQNPICIENRPALFADSVEEYLDEGVDTIIEITGYTKYRENIDTYFLSAGDKVAVISPSALPSKEQTETTLEGLREWGFEPIIGKHVYGEVRNLEECMEDFKSALEDPEIKAIFCVRGGYGATEVMDAMPDEWIKNANKPIIGYSDITACHAAWTCAGLPSIHASMSSAFTDLPKECAEAEQKMITGEIPTYVCESDAYCRSGTAEGILIGGNLSSFTATLDTPYDSTQLEQPYILFLEEVGENMQHIHRYLTILKHKGILENASGILFGEWTELPVDGTGNYGETREGLFESVEDMICRQFLDDVEVPVAFGFPSGHGDVNYPLLMGAIANLEVSEESYTLSWPTSTIP